MIRNLIKPNEIKRIKEGFDSMWLLLNVLHDKINDTEERILKQVDEKLEGYEKKRKPKKIRKAR